MFISDNENHNLIRRFSGNFFVRPIDQSIDETIVNRTSAICIRSRYDINISKAKYT